MSRKVTLLTLMSGRWQTWNPYWFSILNLDWPKEDLQLIWYTNADEIYQSFISEKAKFLIKEGYDIKLFVDRGVKPSQNAFSTAGVRTVEHALAIAALYNSAWDQVDKNNRVMFVEDDIAVPSHSLKRFMNILDEDKEAFYVSGVVFDRHSPAMFAWEIEQQPAKWNGHEKAMWVAFQPQHSWGVRQIGSAGLACTLIEPNRIPKDLEKPLFRPQSKYEGAQQFIGCDTVLCFEAQQHGGKCLLDNDVRALHFDSNGKPH